MIKIEDSHKRGRYKSNTESQESNMEVKRQSKTDERNAKQVQCVKNINYSVRIRENKDQKKLYIWTLFTQMWRWRSHSKKQYLQQNSHTRL